MATTVDDLIRFVSEWRSKNTYSTTSEGVLTRESLFKLLSDINTKIGDMSFEPPKGKSRAFLYSNIVIESDGHTYASKDYMSDVLRADKKAYSIYDMEASRLFGNNVFRKALVHTIGDEFLFDEITGDTIQIDPVSGKPLPRTRLHAADDRR